MASGTATTPEIADDSCWTPHNRLRHIRHVDLTAVPTGTGFWCSWLPFALPQCWPFCWWVLVAVDHFSRRAMGVGIFAKRPDCRAVCTHLGQTLHRLGTAPKYIVCDRDSVFDCDAFRRWAKRKGIGCNLHCALPRLAYITYSDACMSLMMFNKWGSRVKH